MGLPPGRTATRRASFSGRTHAGARRERLPDPAARPHLDRHAEPDSPASISAASSTSGCASRSACACRSSSASWRPSARSRRRTASPIAPSEPIAASLDAVIPAATHRSIPVSSIGDPLPGQRRSPPALRAVRGELSFQRDPAECRPRLQFRRRLQRLRELCARLLGAAHRQPLSRAASSTRPIRRRPTLSTSASATRGATSRRRRPPGTSIFQPDRDLVQPGSGHLDRPQRRQRRQLRRRRQLRLAADPELSLLAPGSRTTTARAAGECRTVAARRRAPICGTSTDRRDPGRAAPRPRASGSPRRRTGSSAAASRS